MKLSVSLCMGLVLMGLFPWFAQGQTAERIRWKNVRLVGSPEPPSKYTVERTFTNVEWKAPLYIAPEPGSDRVWLVLQGGGKDQPSKIVQIRNHPDVRESALVFQLEHRLIYGLTFHPGFATNRFVFLFSNGPTDAAERTNQIVRYTVSKGAPVCETNSAQLILQWRSAGHDGGDLAFGKDQFLYITSGDGTSDSDAWDSGQDVSNLLATLIRIDVDHPEGDRPYRVPGDNPFVGKPDARPEIWAYGFRNPWRMSIDPVSGDIWVGNNGQDLWETAYLVQKGDNYGWSAYEGSHPFYPHRRRGPTPIVPPTIEHSHADFRSLTGGIVYNGMKHPDLNGAYIYGDYGTGKIWGARHRDRKLTWNEELADTTIQIAAFAKDQNDEILIVDHGGAIYRLMLRRQSESTLPFPKRLSETGLFTSTKDLRPEPGLIAYSVNAPGWADGAMAERFMGVPDDEHVEFADRGWRFADGSVLVQTLSIDSEPGNEASRRRIETRLLLRQDKEWTGYSYRWNPEQTDADLVAKTGEDTEISIEEPTGTRRQKWHFPSRSECLACHSRAVNFVLGISDLQLNRTHRYDGIAENQILHLARLGILTGSPKTDPETRPHLVNPYDTHEDLSKRARSYLHANCSVCHVEAGGGNARMQLEFTGTDDRLNLIAARPQHDTFGIQNAMLAAPGNPDHSVLMHRLSRRGRGQMPPLVSTRIDEQAVQLFRNWIHQMKSDSTFVQTWTVADLSSDVEKLDPARSSAAGKTAFEKVGCAQCHRVGKEGGSVGPDLTAIKARMAPREILESILEPSKVIRDEFAMIEIETRSKDSLFGRIERETDREIFLRTGSAVDELKRVFKSDIVRQTKSTTSNMPEGVVNVLKRDEILNLLAFLLSENTDGR